MNINATLLVQGVNFFIAFCMFRRLLFRPVVAIIEAEGKRRAELHGVIISRESAIAQDEAEQRAQREAFQQTVSLKVPAANGTHIFQGIAPQIEHCQISASAQRVLRDEVVSLLIKKVDHVGR